jgi:hypothetical protein
MCKFDLSGKRKIKKLFAIVFCLPAMGSAIHAQTNNPSQDFSVIEKSSWVIPEDDTLSYTFDQYDGNKALLLKRKIQNAKSGSVAFPKNLNFKDGEIDLDIASPLGAAGYVGLAFRIMDPHHYETVYFRPGYSLTTDAIQYMPEKKPEFNWWDYEHPEFQAKDSLPLKGWFHVKVVVKGSTLSVFTHHGNIPVYKYDRLDPGITRGSVGFWLGNSPVGAYKNLVVKVYD